MVELSTKNTKLALLYYIVALGVGFFLLGDLISTWDSEPDRKFGLLIIIGIVLQVLGFMLYLNPVLVKIRSKKEINLKNESIIYIVLGLVLQGVSIYFSL